MSDSDYMSLFKRYFTYVHQLLSIWCKFALLNLVCHKQGGGKGISISLHTSKRKFFSIAAWLSLEPLIVIVGIKVGLIIWVSSPCFFNNADPCSDDAQELTGSGSTFNSLAH